MNFKRKLLSLFFLLLVIMPLNTLAYSDYIIVGGENIGIELNSKGIIVVGYYNVNGKNIGKNAGFQIGDKIVKVDDKSVTSIDDMIDKIDKYMKGESIGISVIRGNKEIKISLKLIKDSNDVYKTGLFVKDQITGVGTLTYIDPETKIYGALGHEIIESNSQIKVEVKDGKIFSSNVTGITKSTETTTGEKNAAFDSSDIYGNIIKNTTYGIFGKYLDEYNVKDLYKVGESTDVKEGSATIVTVLDDDNVETYNINIIKINKNSDTKNILFEITDKKLMNKTNGIIKGMSGSPIIQDNKIIGAVTHAIVNDNEKGYGIFITTMLKEGEK